MGGEATPVFQHLGSQDGTGIQALGLRPIPHPHSAMKLPDPWASRQLSASPTSHGCHVDKSREGTTSTNRRTLEEGIRCEKYVKEYFHLLLHPLPAFPASPYSLQGSGLYDKYKRPSRWEDFPLSEPKAVPACSCFGPALGLHSVTHHLETSQINFGRGAGGKRDYP